MTTTAQRTSSERLMTPARWAVLGLSAIGLGIAIYLTYGHYVEHDRLFCSDNGVVNCQKVTSSPESVVFGVPVAVWGLAFFAVMVAFATPWAWRVPALQRVRIAGVVAGGFAVVYLVYTELFTLDAICLWCTGVHVVTVALLFAVLLVDTRPRQI